MSVRRATHCGSWYSDNKNSLNQQLTQWLSEPKKTNSPARAIITPHAGYTYSGSTAAYAYKQIDTGDLERIFILGPSHHVSYGDNCVLSNFDEYETPFYNLPIDKQVYRELASTNAFGQATCENDEDEHSLEMQLPYIAKIMEGRVGKFTIIPIIVGNLSPSREETYGKILAPYLRNKSNLFVISSDFCHWGKRFRYTHYDEKFGEIWKSIENLDKMGMDAVESLEPDKFTSYLHEYHNTICGRHPIGVLMNCIKFSKNLDQNLNWSLKFIKYKQSEQCRSYNSSSVSYAAASLLQID